MDWEDFQHDHHRPHLLIVAPSGKATRLLAQADFDRLVAALGTIGNYAIKTEGTSIWIACEEGADAGRLADVLKPRQTTRDSEWASKSLASINAAARRRIAAVFKRVPLAKRRILPPR